MSYKWTTLKCGCSWIISLILSMLLTCLSGSEQVSLSGILQSFKYCMYIKDGNKNSPVRYDHCNILWECNSGGFRKMKCLISLDFLRPYIPTLALHLSLNSVLSVIGVPDAECIATVTDCVGKDNRALGAGNQMHPTSAAFVTKLCSILVRSGYWVGQVLDLAPVSAFSLWSCAWNGSVAPLPPSVFPASSTRSWQGFPLPGDGIGLTQEPLLSSCFPGQKCEPRGSVRAVPCYVWSGSLRLLVPVSVIQAGWFQPYKWYLF